MLLSKAFNDKLPRLLRFPSPPTSPGLNLTVLINYVLRRTPWESPPQTSASRPLSEIRQPGAADCVPPCRETYVGKIVELRLIATEVKYPLPRACSSSAA